MGCQGLPAQRATADTRASFLAILLWVMFIPAVAADGQAALAGSGPTPLTFSHGLVLLSRLVLTRLGLVRPNCTFNQSP